MLHTQPPLGTFGIHMGDQCFPSCAHGKEFSRCFRIADGSGETDPPWVHSREPAQPFDKAKGLTAPVAPEEGVDLVDDHEPQISEKLGDGSMLMQQQRLQRFRCDLEDTGGLFQQLRLVTLGHISVPVPYRDIRFGAKVGQPAELIVDQGLQRTDIDGTHRSGRILGK